MARQRHKNKHIEAVLRYAESKGWRVEVGAAHAWGRMYCPASRRGGHSQSIWSTPTSPESHARHLQKRVDACDCEAPEFD